MAIKPNITKIYDFIKKYRYAFLVLLIGLLLMAVPDKSVSGVNQPTDMPKAIATEQSLDERISSILSQVAGAGEVKVLLTVSAGEETVYQTDQDTNSGSDSENTKYDTVTVTDADRNQYGLVRQIHPATYKGAVIVCEGADKAAVRLAIVDAVSKLTGLGANQISVLKMN